MNNSDSIFAPFSRHPENRRMAIRRLRSRRAFTLIEILTVIFIILILMGLLFTGMKKWQNSSKLQLTTNRLEILSSAFAELEAAGHNTFQAQWFNSGSMALDASQIGNIGGDLVTGTQPEEKVLINGNLQSLSPPGVYSRLNALQYMVFPAMTVSGVTTMPGVATIDSTSSPYRYPPFTYPNPTFGPTFVPFGIMPRLTALPTVAKAFSSLGSTALTTGTYSIPGGITLSAPVILDGWGNPILFVPAGGLGNVYLNTGTNSWTQTQDTAVPPHQNVPIVSPDGRPFFVSAGPDGDLLKGDDNVYSFETK